MICAGLFTTIWSLKIALFCPKMASHEFHKTPGWKDFLGWKAWISWLFTKFAPETLNLMKFATETMSFMRPGLSKRECHQIWSKPVKFIIFIFCNSRFEPEKTWISWVLRLETMSFVTFPRWNYEFNEFSIFFPGENHEFHEFPGFCPSENHEFHVFSRKKPWISWIFRVYFRVKTMNFMFFPGENHEFHEFSGLFPGENHEFHVFSRAKTMNFMNFPGLFPGENHEFHVFF